MGALRTEFEKDFGLKKYCGKRNSEKYLGDLKSSHGAVFLAHNHYVRRTSISSYLVCCSTSIPSARRRLRQVGSAHAVLLLCCRGDVSD